MMCQLTEQQDEILHRLVRTDMPVRVIAAMAGVAQGTVTNFRRACMAVDAMSEDLREKIRRCLLVKTPVSQIAVNLNLPVESIWSLRRLDRFRTATETKCSECGTIIFAPMKTSTPSVNRSHYACRFSQANFLDLVKVTEDLLDLSDLQLITNPLFHHLAQRAEKAYQNIHGKKETDTR